MKRDFEKLLEKRIAMHEKHFHESAKVLKIGKVENCKFLLVDRIQMTQGRIAQKKQKLLEIKEKNERRLDEINDMNTELSIQ